MKRIILAALVGAPTTSVSANVQTTSIRLTGAGFKDACSRANHDWVSFCNGYVQAIIDANRDLCPPTVPLRRLERFKGLEISL